jgi:hypothetical protein
VVPVLLALINLRLVLELVSWPDDPSAKGLPLKLRPPLLACCRAGANGLTAVTAGVNVFSTAGLGWAPKLNTGVVAPAGVLDC